MVHNYDKVFWDPYKDTYITHCYGDADKFDGIFNAALQLTREDPIFGYSKFNRAIIHITEEFFNSGNLEDLKKYKFDMIIGDIPNFIMKFLKKELNITNSMYLSPPALPNLFFELFEINSSTLPALGASFTDKMTFFERLQNFVYIQGIKIVFKIYMRLQSQIFIDLGYDSDRNIFVPDSMVLLQNPIGLGINISKPPNMIFLNYITPKPANEIKDLEISEFLKLYEKNIYISQGTIMKNINFDEMMEIFTNLKDVGFILSLKSEISKNFDFPKNVLCKDWVNQNDILGNEKIHGFITHSGINSILEAIYHEKPIIALGVALDQINTASIVKSRDLGVVFTSVNDITPKKLIPAIKEILVPENKYIKNTKKMLKILNLNEPSRKTYLYWLDYGFTVGYEHLIVNAYLNLNIFQVYNYDIGLLLVLIGYVIYYLIKNLMKRLFLRQINIEDFKEKVE